MPNFENLLTPTDVLKERSHERSQIGIVALAGSGGSPRCPRRARSGGLRNSELSDPTITVTSLGEQGVESVCGIIYPPQVAIVGFGTVVEHAWSVQGQVVSRSVITATLSGDHRVSDGHRGGRFFAAVDRLLQEPARL